MLTGGARTGRRAWARGGVALALTLGGLTCASGSAHAGVGPCDNGYVCIVVGNGGTLPVGSGGGGGGGGVGGACLYNGTPMACYVPGIGWLSNADGCYYMEMQPQPPAGDPLWQGHQPGNGAVYVRTCTLTGGGGTVSVWMPAAPPLPPQMTPGELAAYAAARIPRGPATIASAPGTGGRGLVNSPVMLWLVGNNGDYGDGYRTEAKAAWARASVPGLSVTAWLWSTGVTWNTGDGTQLCTTPGTPFGTTYVADCDHAYTKANRDYPVNALVGWHVHWESSTGATGDFDLDQTQSGNQLHLEIDEIQVLN